MFKNHDKVFCGLLKNGFGSNCVEEQGFQQINTVYRKKSEKLSQYLWSDFFQSCFQCETKRLSTEKRVCMVYCIMNLSLWHFLTPNKVNFQFVQMSFWQCTKLFMLKHGDLPVLWYQLGFLAHYSFRTLCWLHCLSTIFGLLLRFQHKTTFLIAWTLSCLLDAASNDPRYFAASIPLC